MLKKNSKIFTDKQLEIIHKRLNNPRFKDVDGHFTNRIKPKLKELLIWRDETQAITELLKDRRKKQ